MPAPSCVIEELPSYDPSDFDNELGSMLMKHDGNTTAFMSTMFGFLKRKSNFFKADDPFKKVKDAYQQVASEEVNKDVKAGFFPQPSKASSTPAATATAGASASPSTVAAPKPSPLPPAVVPPSPAPAAAAPVALTATVAAAPVAAAAAAAVPAASEAAVSVAEKVEELEDKTEEGSKGLKPNDARGANMGHYSWGQTLSEVTVNVPVPAGTRSKMMDVVISKTKLKVGLKGQPPILEGELSETVKVEDCIWNMEGGEVEVSLQKSDGMHWWKSVLKGEPEIDVQKVEPENSKLNDLDAETRQTVEKMMFDQRQKAMGKPTSDEQKREEMMKKFMASHPEMDFSNAKIM